MSWNAEDTKQLKTTINEGVYGTVTSIMVLADGETLFEQYFNEADSATLHNTRSVTKTITGMAIGLAVMDGKLTLSEPVANYFADLAPFGNPDARKLAITTQDLLTMSGPLECDDWNEFSRGNEERMYLVEDWNRFFWDLPVRGFPSWVTPPSESPYGRTFSYCTAGVQMLGELVSRVVEKPATDYIEERLLEPMKLSGFQWSRTASGTPHLGGGMLLNTHALAQFGELQRNEGMFGNTRILSEQWTRDSITAAAVIDSSPGWEYGYLWWLVPYQVDGKTYWSASMQGNGGNRVMILPDFGVTVVFTNLDFNTSTMHQNATAFFEQEIVARLR